MDHRTIAAKNTILLGALLTILGTGTFALIRFDPVKWTALLPALFGILFLLLGIMTQKQEERYRILIYIACGLAILAFFSTTAGLVKTATLIAGGNVEHPATAVEQAISAVLCSVFLATTVKSIIALRRIKIGESV